MWSVPYGVDEVHPGSVGRDASRCVRKEIVFHEFSFSARRPLNRATVSLLTLWSELMKLAEHLTYQIVDVQSMLLF